MNIFEDPSRTAFTFSGVSSKAFPAFTFLATSCFAISRASASSWNSKKFLRKVGKSQMITWTAPWLDEVQLLLLLQIFAPQLFFLALLWLDLWMIPNRKGHYNLKPKSQIKNITFGSCASSSSVETLPSPLVSSSSNDPFTFQDVERKDTPSTAKRKYVLYE